MFLDRNLDQMKFYPETSMSEIQSGRLSHTMAPSSLMAPQHHVSFSPPNDSDLMELVGLEIPNRPKRTYHSPYCDMKR